MKRLTHERCNGIKTGYWSPEKKDELVKALAAYENTGLTPDQIMELKERDTAKERELINGGVPVCPVCGAKVFAHYDFCRDCGQKLKSEAHK